MTLLELAQSIGLHPKKVSSTGGGEFHSPCPSRECGGGENRFIIWPKKGRFWCRQCHQRGDEIQFCRNFMGLEYHEACYKVNHSPSKIPQQTRNLVRIPPKSWAEKAQKFAELSHQRLISDPAAIAEVVKRRGLTVDSLQKFRIGFNPLANIP